MMYFYSLLKTKRQLLNEGFVVDEICKLCYSDFSIEMLLIIFEDRVVGDLGVVVPISRFDISEFGQINRFLRCDLTRAFPGLRDSL